MFKIPSKRDGVKAAGVVCFSPVADEGPEVIQVGTILGCLVCH